MIGVLQLGNQAGEVFGDAESERVWGSWVTTPVTIHSLYESAIVDAVDRLGCAIDYHLETCLMPPTASQGKVLHVQRFGVAPVERQRMLKHGPAHQPNSSYLQHALLHEHS
jgi:hypothetical protein